MALTMYLQQKLNPAPPDPLQAKIMSFLPLMFLFLFATFPAGLVIYWTWNNILSIGQQWIIMKKQNDFMKAFSFKVFSEGISFKSYNELKFYGIPEICFTGRSNVGKSSLINAITNRKSLASTSNKPGHTRKIFFYNIAKKFMLVDLLGYGYAKASKNKIERMSELVFLYLTKRTYLKIVYILIDSRHGFKESDISFLEFLDTNKISFQIVFTKIDKINKK